MLVFKKSRPVKRPGSRGSTKWWVDTKGNVRYGDRPGQRGQQLALLEGSAGNAAINVPALKETARQVYSTPDIGRVPQFVKESERFLEHLREIAASDDVEGFDDLLFDFSTNGVSVNYDGQIVISEDFIGQPADIRLSMLLLGYGRELSRQMARFGEDIDLLEQGAFGEVSPDGKYALSGITGEHTPEENVALAYSMLCTADWEWLRQKYPAAFRAVGLKAYNIGMAIHTDALRELKPMLFKRDHNERGSALGPQSWEITPDDMLKKSDYDKKFKEKYFPDGGEHSREARMKPAADVNYPPGTWMQDDTFKGYEGYRIYQLRAVDVDDLVPSEQTYDLGRGGDVERYAQWMSEGDVPPPITVEETPEGKLKIQDGHRRWHGARRAGLRQLMAWVCPTVETGDRDGMGRPVKVPVTWELSVKNAVHSGEPVPKHIRELVEGTEPKIVRSHYNRDIENVIREQTVDGVNVVWLEKRRLAGEPPTFESVKEQCVRESREEAKRLGVSYVDPSLETIERELQWAKNRREQAKRDIDFDDGQAMFEPPGEDVGRRLFENRKSQLFMLNMKDQRLLVGAGSGHENMAEELGLGETDYEESHADEWLRGMILHPGREPLVAFELFGAGIGADMDDDKQQDRAWKNVQRAARTLKGLGVKGTANVMLHTDMGRFQEFLERMEKEGGTPLEGWAKSRILPMTLCKVRQG